MSFLSGWRHQLCLRGRAMGPSARGPPNSAVATRPCSWSVVVIKEPAARSPPWANALRELRGGFPGARAGFRERRPEPAPGVLAGRLAGSDHCRPCARILSRWWSRAGSVRRPGLLREAMAALGLRERLGAVFCLFCGSAAAEAAGPSGRASRPEGFGACVLPLQQAGEFRLDRGRRLTMSVQAPLLPRKHG